MATFGPLTAHFRLGAYLEGRGVLAEAIGMNPDPGRVAAKVLSVAVASILTAACAATSPKPDAPAEGTPGPHAAPPSAQAEASPRHASHHGHGEGHPHGDHSEGYAMDFSNAEAFAAHFDDPERDAWQKPAEVISLLSLSPGQIVVDLGAGTGYFVGYLARAVESSGRVLALDVEPNMVRHLEQRAKKSGWTNVEPRLVAFDDPGLGPKSVDRVLIVNTWHHISDRERYAAKLSSALRPGGFVFVVDFTLESDMGPPADHRLSPERVVRELESGGLSAQVVDETLPKQYAVLAARSECTGVRCGAAMRAR